MNQKRSLAKIEHGIHLIRGQRVMLDSDLAAVYVVTITRLNEQLRRNIKRFPRDFAFHLTRTEFANLMSQFATSSSHGGRRKLPWVVTAHGAIMLAPETMWERPQCRDLIPNCPKMIGALRPLPHF